MRKVAELAAALIAVLSLAGCAFLPAVQASGRAARPDSPVKVKTPAGEVRTPAGKVTVATSRKTYSLTVAGRGRSYEVIAPATALPKPAPVIVMLSGLGSTVAQEISRDDLVQYAAADKAEIVYPVAVGKSWNAIGCCGLAAAEKVDDLAFLKALVAAVDPGRARPVYVIGYSNGARLAYRVACTDPGLFDAYAMVKGSPQPDCVVREPASIEQLASLDDPEAAYRPGEKGTEPVPVTTEVARLHAADKCTAKPVVTHSGSVTVTAWSGCADGSRLTLAAWKDGKHSFPRPPGSVPAAAQVAWSFFTKTPLAPLP